MSRVFANGPGDQGSLPGCIIPKTQKMVLDIPLLKNHHNNSSEIFTFSHILKYKCQDCVLYKVINNNFPASYEPCWLWNTPSASLQRGKISTNCCPGHDIKLFDGETPT